ncbi:MAG: ParB/RepB/Spo0J family partition protein [Acidobacteria bacterium]|nr:ParB/RepB/Spo0J family partition protein [Acidobacteriota bacterium]
MASVKIKRAATGIPAIGELKEVAIASIVVAAGWNPRSQFAGDGLAELAADIQAHGFIQPPVVTPLENGKYQLVAGERRLRAAKLLGLTHVPVNIKQLDTRNAFEQTVSENLTRVNLHPIEEAEGFERLQRDHGMSIKEIAARTGKHPKFIISRLQLVALGEKVKETILSLKAELAVGYLFLLARIRNDDLQLEVLKQILHTPHNEGLLPLSKAEKLVENYQVALGSAQFKTADQSLYPEVGACTQCPYNTTNLPREAFAKKEVCTNIACFREKQQRQFTKLRDENPEAVFIEAKKAKTIFASYSPEKLAYNCGYVNLDDTRNDYREPGQTKSWRTWLRKFDGEYMPRPHFILNPYNSRIYQLVREDEAEASIKKIKARLNPEEGEQKRLQSERELAERRKQKREQQAKKEAVEWGVQEIARAAVLNMPTPLVGQVGLTAEQVTGLKQYLLLLLRALNNYYFRDPFTLIARQRGLDLSEKERARPRYEHQDILVQHLLDKAAAEEDVAALMRLLGEIILAKAATEVTYSDDLPKALKAAAGEFGVNLEAKRKEILASLKQAEKQKGRKNKKEKVDEQSQTKA